MERLDYTSSVARAGGVGQLQSPLAQLDEHTVPLAGSSSTYSSARMVNLKFRSCFKENPVRIHSFYHLWTLKSLSKKSEYI